MRNRILFIIFFQSVLQCASAQIDSLTSLPLDSLIGWLEVECRTSNQEFPDIAHFALDKALHKNDYENAAEIHGFLSFWNYINYEVHGVDSIIYHRIKQIEYDEQNENWDGVGKGYIDLSIDYLNNNQLLTAQETLFKALKIYQSINDEFGIAEVNSQIAILYIEMSDYENAVAYADISMPIFEREKDYFSIANMYLSVYYEAYFALGDMDAAQNYLDQCIELVIDEEIDQKVLFLTAAYESKANIHTQKQEYRSAETYLFKVWQLNIEESSKEQAELSRFSIGDVLFRQEKYNEALPHLLAGAKAAKVLPDYNSDYDRRISECYEKLEQYGEALVYRKQAAELQEELTQDEIASLKSETLIKYDSGRKDQQLREQNKIIEQKNLLQWMSIGIAVLLTVLLSTLLYFFAKNKKINTILQSKNALIEERNQQNELLLKEIHHRVKNNLETVSALLTLHGAGIEDPQAKTAMLSSQNRVEAMGLLHQKLYQGKNLGSIEMKEYFVNLSEGILEAYQKEDQVRIELAMDQLELDIDTAVPIGLIVNELLTNALKYAFTDDHQANIKISLVELDQDQLRLEVADNGVGYDEGATPSGTGFGTQLVNLLTKQLRGKIDKRVDHGTIISLQLKKVKAA